MSLTTLPTELYDLILSHITSQHDLHSLVFVSHVVSQEAERFLYKNIKTSGTLFLNVLSSTFRDIRLCAFVQSLEIVSFPDATSTIECQRTLSTTLPLLTNLKRLCIKGSLSSDGSGSIFILQNVTTSLEALEFHSIAPEHLPLLARQTQLRELIMDNGLMLWDPAAFPNLRIVGCPGELTYRCLTHPGSKVSRLQWTQDVPEKWWPPFPSIRAMDLFLFTIEIRVFAKIVEKFPSLEYLKCTFSFGGFWEIPDEDDLERISSLDLPSLRKLYLHFLTPGKATPAHLSLFNAIPSLQVIQVQIQDAPESRHWLRQDPLSSTLVPSRPNEWKEYNFGTISAPLDLESRLQQMTLI